MFNFCNGCVASQSNYEINNFIDIIKFFFISSWPLIFPLIVLIMNLDDLFGDNKK